MSIEYPRGSEWRKWDLHVHTPSSHVQQYDDGEDAWEKFLCDLEALPSNFAVIGINDYIFLNGYKRVKDERSKGRLKNIIEVFPVVEFRIKQFAGGFQQKLNYHVIFSPDLKVEVIEAHFLGRLTQKYQLTPQFDALRTNKSWNALVTEESIAELGRLIRESVPAAKRAQFKSDIKTGFHNILVDLETIAEILKETTFADKCLTAIGKTEWSDLKWDDSSIALKKTLANNASFLFTAAEDADACSKSVAKLKEAGVNYRLLDCSDAHHFSDSKEKDRIGNCVTWICADPTLDGLRRAMLEYDTRVFLGNEPPILRERRGNPTLFVDHLIVQPADLNSPSDTWFDVNLSLNPALVAIIGRKGSGKSALADIVAHCGQSQVDEERFAFLRKDKFRKKGLALKYAASSRWANGKDLNFNLGVAHDKQEIAERVRYLPQSFVEDICNETGVSELFQSEIDKVVFSYVPDLIREESKTLAELIQRRTKPTLERAASARQKIRDQIDRIVVLEDKATAGYKSSLVSERAKLQETLEALPAPIPVEKPEEELDGTTSARIESMASRIKFLTQTIADISEQRLSLQQNTTTLTTVRGRLENLGNQVAEAKASIREDAEQLGLDIEAIIQFEIDYSTLDVLLGEMRDNSNLLSRKVSEASNINSNLVAEYFLLEIERELEDLQSNEPEVSLLGWFNKEIPRIYGESLLSAIQELRIDNSSDLPNNLFVERDVIRAALAMIRANLQSQQKSYQEYRRNLANFESQKEAIRGTTERPAPHTIRNLDKEIDYVEHSLGKDIESAYQELSSRVSQLFDNIREKINVLEEIYTPLKDLVESQKERMEAARSRLEFDVGVVVDFENFRTSFLAYVDQSKTGAFRLKEKGERLITDLLQSADFRFSEGVVAFITSIIDRLKQNNMRIRDQLVTGKDRERDLLRFLSELSYIDIKYRITFNGTDLNTNVFSPGEKGIILLIFYLLIDKEQIPLIIDQPEENLDNESIVSLLVPYILSAKQRRQIILVTHNPNLAVVCDAEQIVHATIDKSVPEIRYDSGSIEDPEINRKIVDVLEGTMPAFDKRNWSYFRDLR